VQIVELFLRCKQKQAAANWQRLVA